VAVRKYDKAWAVTRLTVGDGALTERQAEEAVAWLNGVTRREVSVMSRVLGTHEVDRWERLGNECKGRYEVLVSSGIWRGPHLILRDPGRLAEFEQLVTDCYGWWLRYCELYPDRSGRHDYDKMAEMAASAGLKRSELTDDELRYLHREAYEMRLMTESEVNALVYLWTVLAHHQGDSVTEHIGTVTVDFRDLKEKFTDFASGVHVARLYLTRFLPPVDSWRHEAFWGNEYYA
jgi:hypothetical protein